MFLCTSQLAVLSFSSECRPKFGVSDDKQSSESVALPPFHKIMVSGKKLLAHKNVNQCTHFNIVGKSEAFHGLLLLIILLHTLEYATFIYKYDLLESITLCS